MAKVKTFFKAFLMMLLVLPVMLVFTACGSQLDQEADCKTTGKFTASDMTSFENTLSTNEQNATSFGGDAGYRLTMKMTANGSLLDQNYSMSMYGNVIAKNLAEVGKEEMAAKLTMEINTLQMSGKATQEAFLKDQKIYIHVLPTTITAGSVKTEIADTKVVINSAEYATPDYVFGQLNAVQDGLTDVESVLALVKENANDATVEIVNNKITFNNQVAGLTNVVMYFNFKQDTDGKDNLFSLKVEADYTTEMGTGATDESVPIEMSGKISFTLQGFGGDIQYPVLTSGWTASDEAPNLFG